MFFNEVYAFALVVVVLSSPCVFFLSTAYADGTNVILFNFLIRTELDGLISSTRASSSAFASGVYVLRKRFSVSLYATHFHQSPG